MRLLDNFFWLIFMGFLSKLRGKIFVKRYVVRINSQNYTNLTNLFQNYNLKVVQKLDTVGDYFILSSKIGSPKKDKIPFLSDLKRIGELKYFIREKWRTRDLRQKKSHKRYNTIQKQKEIVISDPLFQKQWYMNQKSTNISSNAPDLNILPVWSLGYDGTGVTIAVLDDGLDYSNWDIIKNYNQKASFDFQEYDEDPMPKRSLTKTSHGTKCASIIAGSKNDFCGIGVAYNASIAGIRVIEQKTTDSIEAGALSYKRNIIDIYTCNWGPRDDGERFGRPGLLTSKALYLGSKRGRNGLGSIFVWSSGNGGDVGDDCNADGYVTNLYTIAIGAISNRGQLTYYSEACSSVIAATFSGNTDTADDEEDMIVSDVDNECSQRFSGTSAAASLASGVIALMLQARKNLSWRDVQHVIVENAVLVNPADVEWKRNGAGKWYNRKFGFGGLDATRLVGASINWTSVDAQKKCVSKKLSGPWKLKRADTILLRYDSAVCMTGKNGQMVSNEIQQLEHVQIKISASHKCRGRMQISLISPSGTKSTMLSPRRKDRYGKELQDWIFKSVHFWGETARGLWTLVVTDSLDPDPCKEPEHATTRRNETKTELPQKEYAQNESTSEDASFFNYWNSVPYQVNENSEVSSNKSFSKMMEEIIDYKLERYLNKTLNRTFANPDNNPGNSDKHRSTIAARDSVPDSTKSKGEDMWIENQLEKMIEEPQVKSSITEISAPKQNTKSTHVITKRLAMKRKKTRDYAGLIKSWSLLLYGT